MRFIWSPCLFDSYFDFSSLLEIYDFLVEICLA